MRTSPYRRLAAAAGAACLAAYAARVGRFALSVRDGARAARGASGYSRLLDAHAPVMLLLGDSLAVGLGARTPADSIAGLLAADFPDVSIVNRGRCGARAGEVLGQLRGCGDASTIAAIWISAGANDILFDTPLPQLRDALVPALRACRARSGTVVVTLAADVGRAPLFFWPLSRVLSRRTRRVRALVEHACRQEGAEFVDFLHEARRDPFMHDPRRFFAADGLHPSSECYRHCYRLILARSGLRTALDEAQRQARAGSRDPAWALRSLHGAAMR